MPPARHATAAPRRQPRPSQRKRPRLIAPSTRLRVRWERVGRVALLVVLAVVIGLYAEHAISFFTARSAANRQNAIVARLKHQNAYFEQRRRSLNDLSTILVQARKLGMVRPGEQPYAITGQPSR